MVASPTFALRSLPPARMRLMGRQLKWATVGILLAAVPLLTLTNPKVAGKPRLVLASLRSVKRGVWHSRTSSKEQGGIGMLNRLQQARDIDRFLDDVDHMVTSGIGRARALAHRAGAHPAMDLYDTGTDFVVRALIPGARPEDIIVSIDKSAVSLQGRVGYALGDEDD